MRAAPPATPLAPRLRLGAAVGISVLLSQLTSPGLLLAACAAGLLLALTAGAKGALPLHSLLRRIASVNLFVAMLWLTLPWALQDGGLQWSAAGAHHALLISLRSNAIALGCMALLAGLDAFAIARAAAGLGLPPRLARLLVLTVRYLGVLDDTRRRLDIAMRARGFHPGANRRTVAVLAQQLALILVHAMLRAERVDLALRARGFAAAPVPSARPLRPWRWAAGTAVLCLGSSLLWLLR